MLDIEREEAARIIEEYRENEQTARLNDIGARRSELDPNNKLRHVSDARMQELHREILTCDHQLFVVVQSRLNELRVEASELAQTILTRLIASFEEELNTVALAAETRLMEAGIPIANGDESDWECWHLNEVTFRHSWREVARHQLQKFSHSANDISVDAIQYFCSDEAGVPFAWL